MTLTTMKEDKLKLNKTRPIWILENLEESLNKIYDQYRHVLIENEHLLKENTFLKSEKYKDEELATMKEKYDKMYSDYYRGFPITAEQQHKVNEWMNKQIEGFEDTKIGWHCFHYEFYPTSIGIAAYIVNDLTKEKFQFQEIG